jgi:hypothetical protein
MPLVVVDLKLKATPISQKQYFIPARPRLEFRNTLTVS